MTMCQWLLAETHPLFSARNVGCNLHHVMLDVMHLADLGVNQLVLAAMLYSLPFDCALSGRLIDKLLVIWQELSVA